MPIAGCTIAIANPAHAIFPQFVENCSALVGLIMTANVVNAIKAADKPI